MGISADEARMLQEYEGAAEYIPTHMLYWLLHSPCKITCMYFGNQGGKNETVERDYFLRLIGRHPNPDKNITADTKVRTIRWASESLPSDKGDSEVKNTQYPVLVRRFPKSWITKDISARSNVVQITNPFIKKPVNIEFVSYSQATQTQAGQQRLSVWLDEESPQEFFAEQIPRLLAADGDIIITFTPTRGSSGWMYDYFYERAKVIYRTLNVRQHIYNRTGKILPMEERTNSDDDICVIMAATDDNPIYESLAKAKSGKLGRTVTIDEYINNTLGILDAEPEEIDARRYGMFYQVSGKVYKAFDHCHVVNPEEYPLLQQIPDKWLKFRGIDYHQRTPWACVWMAVSPNDEVFVYRDAGFDPSKMITYDIAEAVASASGYQRFRLDLIDPLANTTQTNTGRTTVQDLNDAFRVLKNLEVGTGGYWQPWDTKNTRGREEVTKRLINSVKCKKPFNNKVEIDGRPVQLPTIWFLNNCKHTIDCFRNWRYEEWRHRDSAVFKEDKKTTSERWSHWIMAVECLLKRPEASMAKWPSEGIDGSVRHHRPAKNYFTRGEMYV